MRICQRLGFLYANKLLLLDPSHARTCPRFNRELILADPLAVTSVSPHVTPANWHFTTTVQPDRSLQKGFAPLQTSAVARYSRRARARHNTVPYCNAGATWYSSTGPGPRSAGAGEHPDGTSSLHHHTNDKEVQQYKVAEITGDET